MPLFGVGATAEAITANSNELRDLIILIVVPSVVCFCLLLGLCGCLWWRRQDKEQRQLMLSRIGSSRAALEGSRDAPSKPMLEKSLTSTVEVVSPEASGDDDSAKEPPPAVAPPPKVARCSTGEAGERDFRGAKRASAGRRAAKNVEVEVEAQRAAPEAEGAPLIAPSAAAPRESLMSRARSLAVEKKAEREAAAAEAEARHAAAESKVRDGVVAAVARRKAESANWRETKKVESVVSKEAARARRKLEGAAAAARERDLARQASFKAAEAKAAEAAEAAAATPQALLADAAAALAALPPEGAELLEKVSGWQADEVGRLTIRLRCQQTLLKKRAAAGGAPAPAEPPDLPARAAAWSTSHLDKELTKVSGGGAAAATLLAVCRELIRRELPPSRHLPPEARNTERERDALRWCEEVVATLGPLSLLHVRNEWILGAVADQRRGGGAIGAQRDWLRQQEEGAAEGPAAKKKNDGWV